MLSMTGGGSRTLRYLCLARRGRIAIGIVFADITRSGPTALAGLWVCLALAPEPASAALSPGAANANACRSVHRSYESFGQFAQSGGPSFVARELYGEPSKPLPMAIRLPDAIRNEHRFIMIIGLPDEFRMSSGFRTKSAWLVSAREIPDLQLLPPQNFVGKIALRISLVTDGNKAEDLSVGIIIRPRADEVMSPAPNAGPASSINTSTGPSPAAQPPLRKQVSDDEENAALQRAATFLANADISAARLIYETLAMKGSARAASAMGQTYDPEFLAGQRIEGLQPDVERARRWYKKALALGSQDATARLVGLEGR